MRKRALGLLAASAAFFGAAAPALAYDYQANKMTAYAAVTKECLRYTGCASITLLANSGGGGECSQWAFKFHTQYYGWLPRTVYVHANPKRSVCVATNGGVPFIY